MVWIESILFSVLPVQSTWTYNYCPSPFCTYVPPPLIAMRIDNSVRIPHLYTQTQTTLTSFSFLEFWKEGQHWTEGTFSRVVYKGDACIPALYVRGWMCDEKFTQTCTLSHTHTYTHNRGFCPNVRIGALDPLHARTQTQTRTSLGPGTTTTHWIIHTSRHIGQRPLDNCGKNRRERNRQCDRVRWTQKEIFSSTRLRSALNADHTHIQRMHCSWGYAPHGLTQRHGLRAHFCTYYVHCY